MSTILAVDLGKTTGYAVLVDKLPEHKRRDLGLLASGVIPFETLEEDLKKVLLGFLPTIRVVEEPVVIRGPLGDTMEQAKAIARRILYPFAEWAPSRWKPHPLAKTPLPGVSTAHERDAIRLGLVYRALVVEK